MDSAPPSRFAWLQTWPGILTVGFFALILLTALAYVEENWRGDLIWAQTKAELEARGESFDRTKFIPPSVPDDQNFGALDYFQTSSDHRLQITKVIDPVTSKTPNSVDEAKENTGKGWLPYLGKWMKSETTDTEAIEKQLEDFLHHQDPAAPIAPGATPIDTFTRICPVLADLRKLNPQRPLCRFDLDYDNPRPWLISLSSMTDQLKVAKILSYDSQLALLSHQPEIALQDSQVAWKVYSGLSQRPMLISGLVALGVMAIQLNVIEKGLNEHDWTEAQLAQIDMDLGKLDVLADGQRIMRGEVTVFEVPIMEGIVANRSSFLNLVAPGLRTFDYKDLDSWEALPLQFFYFYMPNGWLQINHADSVRRILDGTRAIDSRARRVYADRVDAEIPPSENGSLGLLSVAVGPVLHGIRKFAYAQAQIDMTRIACRLERYHLAHGSFPATLDALTPDYGTDLPHDIMTGKPYIYRLDKDGNYTLYSIGWNQQDDGGDNSEIAGMPNPSNFSSESLDWLWPNHVIKPVAPVTSAPHSAHH